MRRYARDLVRVFVPALLLSACAADTVTEEEDSGFYAQLDAQTVQRGDAASSPPRFGDGGAPGDGSVGPGTDAGRAFDAGSAPDAATVGDAASTMDASTSPDAAGSDARVADAGSDARVADAGGDARVADAGSDARVADAGSDARVADAGSDARVDPPEGPIVGVYCGNSVDGVRQFETWLGRPVEAILGYTGNADWADYEGSVPWAANLWSALDRRVLWSVPLIVNGASLAQAATGAYDEHYRKAAQGLANYRPQEPVLYIRTGWEFNGNWFPWNAQGGKHNDFISAFRRFVTVFRSVSNRFVFEWNVNIGDVGMNPELAYPGDDYVDIIGMDFYWQDHLPTTGREAWNQVVSQQWGLQWHQDFARRHGKRTAYSEWGVKRNDAYYVQQAAAWFEAHDVVYQTYWNANNDYPGKLSDNQYPIAGNAYKAAFGP